MNPSLVGNQFEQKIFHYLDQEIKSGRFLFKPECCRIFRKKGYYSKDRGKEITFDIAVEVYLPGSSEYSVLIVIECKNYKHSVPVDDAEEFFAKLQQVSGANVKGIIAATREFQAGAYSYCRSKGIGLFRYFDETQVKWVLKRSASTLGASDLGIGEPSQIHEALIRPAYTSERYSLFCCLGGEYTNSARKFFHAVAATCLSSDQLALIETPKPTPITFVDFLTKEQIEERANNALSAMKHHEGAVDLDELCKALKDGYGRQVKVYREQCRTRDGITILGRIRFSPPVISIYQSPEISRERERFTLAHELGHLLLGHSKYLRAEYCEVDDFKIDETNTYGDLRSLEWQANYFAACLLLPKHPLVKAFCNFALEHGIKYRGWGFLFVDQQPCNQHNYYITTNHLKWMFEVSRAAITLRLQEVGILKDMYGVHRFFKGTRRHGQIKSRSDNKELLPRRSFAVSS
jgi:Zn-dependent peptidase ImmA (M78 family)